MVCLESCRKYCSQVAWLALMSVVDILRKTPLGTVKDALIQFMMKVKHQLPVIAALIGIIFMLGYEEPTKI